MPILLEKVKPDSCCSCLAFLYAQKSGSVLIFFDCPYEGDLLAVCSSFCHVYQLGCNRGGWNVICFAVSVHHRHHVVYVSMYVMKQLR